MPGKMPPPTMARWPQRPEDPRGAANAPKPILPTPYTVPSADQMAHQSQASATATGAPSPAPAMSFRAPAAAAAAPRQTAPKPTLTPQERLAKASLLDGGGGGGQSSRPAQQPGGAMDGGGGGRLSTEGTGALSTDKTDLVLQQWSSGAVDFTKPIPLAQGEVSSYGKLRREAASGKYTSSWGPMDIGDPHVPPWERTMSEIYGKEHVDALRAQGAESYVERANRFAKEEAARRASGSRKALGGAYE
jgi:hypothetical protein